MPHDISDNVINRRDFGKIAGAALLAGPLLTWPALSLAANPTGQRLHGLSAFGDLKYASDYTHHDYVNVEAPKGGIFNFAVGYWAFNQNPQTFDTLNSFVLKGNSPPRMELCFDSLMTSSTFMSIGPIDEPAAAYGRIAESVEISKDRNTYTFYLRPEARFHNGSPITANDIKFSLDVFKKDGHPDLALDLINLERTEVISANIVAIVFNGKQSDRAVLSVISMPIVSSDYFASRTFTDGSLEAPLGSGPYKVGRFDAGNYIQYDRVTDYWGKDLPFAQGLYNFDTLRIEFYRERQAAFEAFKKGNIHWRQEFTSKSWAKEYEFPAVQDGRVKRATFPSELRPSLQGFVINLRREKFIDPRTRAAIGLCFDFEWTNANLFFGAYTRNQSYFERSSFIAQGEPGSDELALLEPLRELVDESVFGPAIVQPVSNGKGRDRKLLRKASELLSNAGWTRDGNQLVDASGQPFSIEFLLRSPSFERILAGFVTNLKAVGIQASLRLVDPSQYQKRTEDFDFDITTRALSYGALPTGEGLEQIFGSASAKRYGSQNIAGLADPAVDALIEKVSKVKDQGELTVVLKALDRVLRSTHSWIPNWHSANHRVAYWDMFGFPEKKPDYAFPVEAYWWYDAEKAKAIGKG